MEDLGKAVYILTEMLKERDRKIESIRGELNNAHFEIIDLRNDIRLHKDEIASLQK